MQGALRGEPVRRFHGAAASIVRDQTIPVYVPPPPKKQSGHHTPPPADKPPKKPKPH